MLLLLRNIDVLIEQARTKSEESSEFERSKAMETFSFDNPLKLERNWMLGLIDIELHKSFLTITEERNIIKLERKRYWVCPGKGKN